MNRNCSEKLKKDLEYHMKDLDKKARPHQKKLPKLWPAVSIGCECNEVKECKDSGGCVPKDCEYALKMGLNRLGPIGSVVPGCDNKNGACAEDHASNEVLKGYRVRHGVRLSLRDLVFTNSIRPRTRQKVRACANCRRVF